MSKKVNRIQELIQEERERQRNPDPDLNLDISTLLRATENVDIENLSTQSISEDMINAFQELNMSNDDIAQLCEKLTEYRYIDQIHMLHKGKHIRWLRITSTANQTLTNGGIVMDIKFLDNGIYILCKNGFRFMQIRFDDCLIFQKMTADEMLVLSCCDILRQNSA